MICHRDVFPPLLYKDVNSHVKSDDGYAKHVSIELTAAVPKPMKFLTIGLFLFGATTVLYLLALLARWMLA